MASIVDNARCFPNGVFKYVWLAFLCFFCNGGVSTDTLRPGEWITQNQTLVSAGGRFALGFFSPGNSSSFFLGIWYNAINNSVIWVANRESPLPQHSNPVFTLAQDGNLRIINGKGETIWSTNVSGAGFPRTSPETRLLNSGNLVLKQGDNDSPVWQSFDHACDTLMPGMKLKVNTKNHTRNIIKSWTSKDDPRPGKFSWGMDPNGSPQFFIWKENSPYFRSNLYQYGFNWSLLFPVLGYSAYYSFAEENDEVYFSYGYADISEVRFILTPDGYVQTQLNQKRTDLWLVRWHVPANECEFYSRCGAFGSCECNGSHPVCSCLKGFRPKSQKDWDNGNHGGGCERIIDLRCDEEDVFMRLPLMKWPDHSTSMGSMGFKDCVDLCSRNCSCKAYAYANISSDSTVNCINWFGDLVDLVHNYSAGLNGYGQDLYVRVHTSNRNENSGHRNRTLVAIIVTLVAAFILVSALTYILRRKYFRRRDWEAKMSTMVNSLSVSSLVGKGDIELLQLSLERITDATNNFDEANKLGEGGFGPVYKGFLSEFGMVAIKRLSKRSSQGLGEFMNELKLIAKLQHKNLVSLLGCCTEDDEKILIYEYLPKRSLDKFLFGTAWDNWKEGRALEFVDPAISKTCDSSKAIRCIEVGLLCVQPIPTDRPTMSDVVVMLSNLATTIPKLKEPAFVASNHSNTVVSSSQGGSSGSNNEVTISAIEPR
nr:G-type lectin S-receptor-like serine/threonine-protein kinase At4g27290 [Ipomoea trifida]